MKNFLAVILSSGILYGGIAQGDDDVGFFAGIGLSRTDVSANEFDESVNEPAIKFGYMFSENWGFGIDAIDIGSENNGNSNADVGIVAISAIGSFPLANQIDVYGKAGAAQVALDISNNDVEVFDERKTEFFWGVGSELDFGSLNLFVEYNRFDAPSSGNINSLVLGTKWEF